MQSDYVVRFTGQDNLSNTVNKVKKDLQDVGSASSSIEKINQKFEKIINSSAPLKRQLRDLQGIMAKMNLDGLSNTEQFTKIAEEAGRIKNAISDASVATQKYANDTMALQASIQAFQGIAAAGTTVVGVMGLLGTENENVKNSILKVQSALAVLNGVQAIANTLNKDSVLMLKMKQIWTATNTAATVKETVATTVNTMATIANTTATKAWNVAKAIGKAILGDYTGLILVGAGALVTYALSTNKATDTTEKNTNAIRTQNKAFQAYQNTISDLTGKYVELKSGWRSLKTTFEKNAWIKNNQQKFAELGVSISNVTDAEKVFGSNTQAIVQSMIQRAKYAMKYQEAMQLVRQIINEQTKHNNAVAAGEDEFVHLAKANELQGQLNEKVKEMQKYAPKQTFKTSGGSAKSSNTNKSGGSTEVKAVAGSIQDLQNKISELQKKLNYGLIPADKISETKKRIAELKSELGGKKALMQGFQITNDSSLTKYTENVRELEKTDLDLVNANQLLINSNMQLDEFWNNDAIDNSIKQLHNQITAIEKNADAWGYYAQMIGSVGQAMDILGNSSEAQVAKFAVNTAAILANAVSTIAAMNAEALAKGASSAFSLPFPANLAAWATVFATITSIFASLPKFAEGGVVGGNSYFGDKVLARVNSGEMIFNKRQQKNLFNALDGGGVYEVVWKLRGADLYGSMKNYSKTVAKTGKRTGII